MSKGVEDKLLKYQQESRRKLAEATQMLDETKAANKQMAAELTKLQTKVHDMG